MRVVCTASIAVGLLCAVISPPTLGGPQPDLTGRKRVGIASFYARSFNGKTMANGAPMNPRSNQAASRTLPLGTLAKVTNLETGKSAVVRIEDRGPYIKGRIVDLTPHTARRIGITQRKGISRVVVAPIAIPLPHGRVKLGAGARDIHDSHVAREARKEHAARSARDTREARRTASVHGSRGVWR